MLAGGLMPTRSRKERNLRNATASPSMKSSRKLSILGALLLLAARATEATPITSTDAINFGPNVYISQWNAGLNPAADAVTNFTLNLDLLSSSGTDSLAL